MSAVEIKVTWEEEYARVEIEPGSVGSLEFFARIEDGEYLMIAWRHPFYAESWRQVFPDEWAEGEYGGVCRCPDIVEARR